MGRPAARGPDRAITAAAIALYQTLGFLITMALLLFALLFGAERRNILAAAAFSVGVVALAYWLFGVALKIPLERGLSVLALGTLESLLLGFSVALQPDVCGTPFSAAWSAPWSEYCPASAPSPASAFSCRDLRPRRHQVDRDARRHLLRLAIWRLHHVDPDADPGRSRLGDDLHRRLCHGEERAAGAALCIAAVGSWIAGTFGVIVLTLIAPPLADFALRFGPPEYTALLVLGLIFLAYMSTTSLLRTLLMAASGSCSGPSAST